MDFWRSTIDSPSTRMDVSNTIWIVWIRTNNLRRVDFRPPAGNHVDGLMKSCCTNAVPVLWWRALLLPPSGLARQAPRVRPLSAG